MDFFQKKISLGSGIILLSGVSAVVILAFVAISTGILRDDNEKTVEKIENLEESTEEGIGEIQLRQAEQGEIAQKQREADLKKEELERQPPGPPKNLRVEPGNGSVKINWDKPDDTGGTKLNEYIITLMPDQDPFPVPYNKEDSQSYTLNDLKNNSEYSIKIISVNEFGTSDPVLSESFIPFDDPVPPSKIYVEAVAEESI